MQSYNSLPHIHVPIYRSLKTLPDQAHCSSHPPDSLDEIMEKYKVAKADLPVVLYAVKAIPAASDLSLIRFVAADTEFSPSTEEDVLESFNKSDLHSPYIQTWDSPSRGRAAADRVKKRYGGEWMCFTIDPQELETVLRSPKYEHGGEHSGEYLVLHRIPFRAVLDNELRAQNRKLQTEIDLTDQTADERQKMRC